MEYTSRQFRAPRRGLDSHARNFSEYETCRKIKVILLISMLAVAEARQAQQDVRFNPTGRAHRVREHGGVHAAMTAELTIQEQAKHIAGHVAYIITDLMFQKTVRRLAEVDTAEQSLSERAFSVPSLYHADLENTTFGKLGGKPMAETKAKDISIQRRAEVTESVDRFLDSTYGSGIYQLRVFLLAGALFVWSFPFTQLCVFTHDKMVNDPKLPQFTQQSVSTCESLVFIGWAVGTLVWAPAFDHWGRRSVTYGLGLASSAAFICSAVATYPSRIALYVYAVSNFIIGLGLPFMQGAFTMVQEIFPTHLRARATSGIMVAYSMGLALMAALCGYVTHHLNWHMETLIWSAYCMLLVVVGFPLLQESLRFLVAKGNVAEATLVAKTVAKTNGVGWLQLQPKATHQSERVAVKSHRLLHRRFILRLLACALNWITVSVCYYGLTFAAGAISPDIYLNVILLAMVDISGYFAVAPILSVVGRIKTHQMALVIAAAFLLLSGFIPHGSWMLLACVLVGRISVDIAFATTYQITAECFPTDCRSTAFSLSSSAGRFMTLVAPLMSRLPLRTQCFIFPSLCIFAAAVTQFLPETAGQGMDDSSATGPKGAARSPEEIEPNLE